MKATRMFAAFLVFAAPIAVVPAQAADENRFAVFGTASEMDPDQTGAGGGLSVSWEWTNDVALTARGMFGTYDDFDRGQVLFGGEWRDQAGRATGYIGLQGGVDMIDTDLGSEEDSFLRAYYDIGWQVSGKSQLRLGIGYDTKTELVDRGVGARASWTAELTDSMSFFLSAEIYDEEKNGFAGVSWGF